MSKRYILKSSSSSAPAHKRQRVAEFGAPTEDDVRKPPRDSNAGHSSTSSRNVKPPAILALTTLAARVFARGFPVLYATDEGVERTRPYFQAMPDPVANRLFDAMRELCPGYIPHAVIAPVRCDNAKLV